MTQESIKYFVSRFGTGVARSLSNSLSVAHGTKEVRAEGLIPDYEPNDATITPARNVSRYHS